VVDGVIIGTKVFFGFAGAGALHNSWPFFGHLTHHAHHSGHVVLPVLAKAGPVGNAFLWMAAGGGSANILAGTGSQFFTGAYCKYQPRLIWFNSRNPLPAAGL
jgi:hypothetical protein